MGGSAKAAKKTATEASGAEILELYTIEGRLLGSGAGLVSGVRVLNRKLKVELIWLCAGSVSGADVFEPELYTIEGRFLSSGAGLASGACVLKL